jgi:hypothetical protein
MNKLLPSHTSSDMPQAQSRHGGAIRPGLLRLFVMVLVLVGALQVGLAWSEIVSSGMDIQQDYIAAQRLRAGGDIYAPILPAEVLALGVHEEYGVGMRLNVHPPLTALLFAPLTFLSFPVATLIWTIGSVAILMGVIYLLIVELQLPLFGLWRLIVPLATLTWYPVWQHLHVGQFTILLLGLIVGAWYCERRGHSWLAGLLLGFAMMLKIYPVLLLGYALLRGRWRVIAGAVAIILALALLQAAVNPGQWADYIMHVAPANAAEWVPNARNASLASVSMRLFVGSNEVRPFFNAPQLELPTRIVLYCIALSLLALVFWRLRKRPDLTGEYGLCLSAIALLSPLSWDHATIFLLMPFAYIWQQAQLRPGRWRRGPLACMGLALLLSMFPAEIVFANLKRAYQLQQMPPIVHLHATGVAVLICGFAAIVLTLWRLPMQAGEGQLC